MARFQVYPFSMATDDILRVTDSAQAMVLEIRAGEDNAAELALWLEVNGSANGSYTYDMWFQSASDAGESDEVADFGELKVIVAASSVDRMRGATLDVGTASGEPGLVMLNPNAPSAPRRTAANYPEPDLSSPVAQK